MHERPQDGDRRIGRGVCATAGKERGGSRVTVMLCLFAFLLATSGLTAAAVAFDGTWSIRDLITLSKPVSQTFNDWEVSPVHPPAHTQSPRVVRPHLGVHDALLANNERPVGPNTTPTAIPPTDGPIIQLCLVLDTSNSMDGLINQAKARLWSVVSELGRASEKHPCPRCGPTRPQLQVAVYEYGNNTIEASDGYVRLRIPFTTDLDLVSEQLFSLTTNGGLEYCGWAIRKAVSELAWVPVSGGAQPGLDISPVPVPCIRGGGAAHDVMGQNAGPRATVVCDVPPVDGLVIDNHQQPVMRVLVIAGNEPFTQGTVHYAEAIAEAVASGIRVHTVFCGDEREGRTTGWADGARLGNGRYMSINQDTSFIDLATPFDGRLLDMNTRLNATYLPYGGTPGRVAFERQAAQDRSSAVTGNLVGRASVKASASLYSNIHWDLLDALEAKTITLEQLKPEDLPEVLRGKSIVDQRRIVESYQRDRERIRGEMSSIARERAEYLRNQHRRGIQGVRLDDAIVQAVREQAESAGLRFIDDDGADGNDASDTSNDQETQPTPPAPSRPR